MNYVLGSSVQNVEVPPLPPFDKLKQFEKEVLNAEKLALEVNGTHLEVHKVGSLNGLVQ